jgi:hypothetical protein
MRRAIRRTIFRSLPHLAVVSYSELPTNMQIKAVGFIRHQDVMGAMETAAEQARNAAEGLSMPSGKSSNAA